MALIRNSEDNKYFGKKWEFETNSMFAVLLLAAAFLFLVYFCYLNFSAIGKSVDFYTGIHTAITLLGLFGISYVLKKKYGKGGKAISQALWLTMGAIGMYWVLTHSNWEFFQKAILVSCHILAYINLTMNALTKD